MFDLISGLPVHVLVVHAVVVGLPLMAVVTFLTAVLPRWRAVAAVPVAAVNAVLVALCLVARESGEQLQARLGGLTGTVVAEEHGDEGGVLWLFALALVIAAGACRAASGRPKLVPVAMALAAVAALGAIGWTVVVGDSGSRSVWEQTIVNTRTP